jgi:hypothetical protein
VDTCLINLKTGALAHCRRLSALCLRLVVTIGAIFYTTGMEHSPTSATGTAWERTPWHATQRAALEALTKGTEPEGETR